MAASVHDRVRMADIGISYFDKEEVKCLCEEFVRDRGDLTPERNAR